MEAYCDGGLEELLSRIAADLAGVSPAFPWGAPADDRGPMRLRGSLPACAPPDGQRELFAEIGPAAAPEPFPADGAEADSAKAAGDAAAELKAVSPAAYGDFLHAWLSERPVEAALRTFAAGLLAAARSAQTGDARAPLPPEPSEAARDAAERFRTDRGRGETAEVLAAAYATRVELHRLEGLLRFRPSAEGPYVARCSPDHLVLPLMADHFAARFGETDWAVVDERRSLALLRMAGDPVRLSRFDPNDPPFPQEEGLRRDEIESLWRGYYTAVAIENRANPSLRRRLMPVRYWKYLVEV